MFRKPRADPNAEPKGSAIDCALALLARRELSERELSGRLAAQGHAEAAIEEALVRLRESRYVDNERFAGMATRSLIGRGKGPRALQARLSGAGIDAETAALALPEALDWTEQARETLIRRFGEEVPTEAREWTRRARFLLARGFTETQARTALGPMPPAPRPEPKPGKPRSGFGSRKPRSGFGGR